MGTARTFDFEKCVKYYMETLLPFSELKHVLGITPRQTRDVMAEGINRLMHRRKMELMIGGGEQDYNNPEKEIAHINIRF